MSRSALPRLILTPGEPAGIGPDLAVMLAGQHLACELIVAADPELLKQRAERLGVALRIETLTPDHPVREHRPGGLSVVPVALRRPAQCGQLDAANAGYVLDCLRLAVEWCVGGRSQALVTGPVHKGIVNDAGIAFSGHTEYLAELTGGYPVMMLTTPGLRVALATTHLPLRQVADAVDPTLLEQVLSVLHRDLIGRFGIAAPRIAVCGLNPHAGEGGHLGREEIEVIEPVLERLRRQGMKLRGPLPADTAFLPSQLEQTDAVLAMYHDQGLPVLKHRGFGRAVNVTLGLPLIRTSVDHGTALDLAGTGQADAGSLRAALDMAMTMARNAGG